MHVNACVGFDSYIDAWKDVGGWVELIITILHEHDHSVSLAKILFISTFGGSTFENLAMQRVRIRQLRRRLRIQIVHESADGVLNVSAQGGFIFSRVNHDQRSHVRRGSTRTNVAHNTHLYSGRFSAVTSPSARLCEDFLFAFFLASTANARSTIRL